MRKYCEEHPDLPDLTLARLIYSKNKALFPSVNSVRDSVRYHRGAKDNGWGVHKKPVKATREKGNFTQWEYRAPKSHADTFEDFIIHGAQRVLRLSDIHYPFHDEWALESAINHGVKFNPTLLLLCGDIIDCHDLSDYERDPRTRYTELELRTIAEELEQYRKAFPSARIIYQAGNHEKRLERYLMRKSPELFGLPGMDIPGLIAMVGGPASIRGMEWVKDERVVRTGHLAHIHGHEFRGGGGVNPARWLFLRTGENAMMGHCHRTSEHSEPNLSRKPIACWSTGCLSELTPPYMRHNKWNHGFATIEVDSSGEFMANNHRIINGRVR